MDCARHGTSGRGLPKQESLNAGPAANAFQVIPPERFATIDMLFPASAAGIGVNLALGSFHAGGFAVSGVAEAVVALIAIGAAMAIVYVGALAALRSPELRDVAGVFTRRFRRAS